MAFSVDQASLGTAQGAANATSFTLTTTNAVASGALIVIGLGWFTTNGISSLVFSGGGLSWTTGISVGTGAGSDGCAIGWALAPSGLATSTVLTANGTTGNAFNDPIMGAMSFLGSATSTPTDGTSSKAASAPTANVWTGNAITTSGASDLVIGVGWGDGNTSVVTDTPTSPWVAGPLLSDSGAAGGVMALEYQLNVAAGNYSPGGTWGGTVKPTTSPIVGMGFKAAGGTGFVSPSRMPLSL
jgi:hypothetical protein